MRDIAWFSLHGWIFSLQGGLRVGCVRLYCHLLFVDHLMSSWPNTAAICGHGTKPRGVSVLELQPLSWQRLTSDPLVFALHCMPGIVLWLWPLCSKSFSYLFMKCIKESQQALSHNFHFPWPPKMQSVSFSTNSYQSVISENELGSSSRKSLHPPFQRTQSSESWRGHCNISIGAAWAVQKVQKDSKAKRTKPLSIGQFGI